MAPNERTDVGRYAMRSDEDIGFSSASSWGDVHGVNVESYFTRRRRFV